MSMINIHSATSSHPLLQRLNLFPGRYLGETEFDKRQKYMDYRLLQLANSVSPGILQGLEVISPETEQEWISISPGSAIDAQGQVIGLAHRVRQSWQALILQYQLESNIEDAQGIYYLSLRRTSEIIDGSDINDACRKRAIDPHRDIQSVVTGELFLKRLSLSSALLESSSADNIANHVCAAQVSSSVFSEADYSFMTNGMPLALVAITKNNDQYGLKWIRSEAGRYLSGDQSLEKTLAHQVEASMTKVLKTMHQEQLLNNFADEFETRLDINFLPAIGQLPLPLLEQPASFITTNQDGVIIDGPNMRFLPTDNNIDMIPVPESSLSGLIQREQSRGVIDLSESRQSIRLLLVLNDRDYKPDLLDFPEPDQSIEDAVYQYSQRAHDQWLKWKKQFYSLYYVLDKNELNKDQIAAIKLPQAIRWPQTGKEFFTQLIKNEHLERGVKKIEDLPLPYRNGVPAAPQYYTDWLINDQPPLAPRSKKNGLVVESILNTEEIERSRNSLRAKGILLEKIHDLLVLQRQQLDINTVSMATLAGGVASDGSGMQIARWWPHMDFNNIAETTEPDNSVGIRNTTSDSPGNSISKPKNIASSNIPLSANISSPFLGSVITPQKTSKDSDDALSIIGLTSKQRINTFDIQTTPLFEYSTRFEQLNLVSNQQKSKVSEPLFTVDKKNFGVLKHLQPEMNEYLIAWQGLDALFKAYEEVFDSKELAALKLQLKTIENLSDKDSFVTTDKNDTSKQGLMNQAMFKISRLLLHFISIVELRNDKLENEILQLNKDLKKLYALRSQLLNKIDTENNKLKNINTIRLEYLGDYNMAQSLLTEEWLRVEQQHDHRTRVLESLKGLYYVKVRRTPISIANTAEQSLYYQYEGDLIPGCHLKSAQEIPESLDNFYDSILEIPIKYWQSLQDKLHLLPNSKKIKQLYELHQSRLSAKTQIIRSSTRTKILPYFNNLIQQNNSILFELGQLSINTNETKAQLHHQVQQVLSLEDINQLRTGKLRESALQLKDDLSQCILCLLENLQRISPAIRLQWAQLAEDDRLPLEDFQKWPGLQVADQNDFEPLKNTQALIQWWFAQTAKNSPRRTAQSKTEAISMASSHSAQRNMIRAILIEAAHGDAAEILQGKVQIIPPVFRPGEILRLKLNREAFPGIKLDLLSPAQEKVAQLQIEDEDEQGVIARIVQISSAKTQISTKYSVIESSAATVLMTSRQSKTVFTRNFN